MRVSSVLLPAEGTAIRPWWGYSRIEWRSKGGSGGWSVQSARRNDRLSARYVPSRYHKPRFTNVVHCYVLEKYWRSTLLAVRTRARPPLVTYAVDVVFTAVVAREALLPLNGRRFFLKISRELPGDHQLSMIAAGCIAHHLLISSFTFFDTSPLFSHINKRFVC